jgi:predicted DNA-binding protein
MARKTATITIEAEGRDKGKVFVLTELSASDAEDWAMRALFALMNAGVEVPDNLAEAGLAGVATMGMDALKRIPYEAAKPLMDTMKQCIKVKLAVVRELIEDDIEEMSTWFYLRKQVLLLHMDFSMAAALSTLGQGAAEETSA